MQRILSLILLGSTLTLFLFGCSPSEDQSPTPPPRVRTFEVGETSRGQDRSVSGRLAAADSSPLAFGVAGTVDSVTVNVGDTVTKGQVLAVLDADPLRQALERARSDLSASRAKLVEAERSFNRVSVLLKEFAISQSDVEVAESKVKSARAIFRGSQSSVDDRERDLKRARLLAPYSGRVSERSIEAFQEVGANESAFVIQSNDALVVQTQVAESLIRHVDYAQPTRVTFPTIPELEVVGIVSLIAAQAGAGNAFPVEIQLPTTEADLRPGMSAEVTFNFSEYLDGRTVYLIPLSSVAIDIGLLAGGSPDDASVPVFIYDEVTGTALVKTIAVGGLRGNQLEVFEGLEKGDQVISAGVSFLHDGMPVRLWTPTLGITGG